MRSLKQTVIILIFLSTVVGLAQKSYTEESVKTALKQGFVEFVDDVRPAYSKGDTYLNFKQKALLGKVKPTSYILPPVPVEGEDLLKKAYQFLAANYSSKQLLENADYKVYGKAIMFIHNYSKNNNREVSDGEIALFGGNEQLLDDNTLIASSRGVCKWWQLSCHLNQIFGNGGGGQILQIIIDLIIILIL
ncbi:hypothetical protein [Rasiella sp. SM2506]|uniref:hypothetical protein n=1 Tax=Rasiella sp. SM2506 TaxID=3423914 RepID=UPI003D79E170